MKDNKATQQMKMFKKEIPQMPEGYYSSGPNPNLEKFIMEHATPYDPATDDYNVPPFNKPIKTTKATAIYNMHTYWSKKPHDAIQQYVRHYTEDGDLVLDPFCGSGGTALAALLEGRKAIAIDLSPAATFITKNYCSPVDISVLQKAFNELEEAVKPEMDWLYETKCDRCDGRAKVSYTLWSSVFECPRCLSHVPLFDCPETIVPKKSGNSTKTATVCPICKKNGQIEEIDTRYAKRINSIPVLINYECLDGCSPKREDRAYNDENPKKKKYFEKYDQKKLEEINNLKIPYWYPATRMMNIDGELDQRWGILWRKLHTGINTVADFYTKRNLWAISLIIAKIKETSEANDALLFLITSLIYKASKMMGHNSDGIGRIQKGTYYVPPNQHIINVWNFMVDSLSDFMRGYEEINKITNNALIVSTQSATNLEDVSDLSIDYIFTDPPYSGTVQYGELNFLWEAWLRFNTDWHNNEIIVNELRSINENNWVEMMFEAMAECYRVLKPGRWISLCYHDTSEGTWQLVQDIMTEVGFIPEQVEQALFIDTATKTVNQYFGTKVTKRDLVINFRKPRPGEIHAAIAITGDEDERTFSQKARAILTEALERSPGSTADRLYDELVSRMVRKGEFERHNFDKLLREVAEEVQTPDARGNTISRWYLLETAGEVDAAESQKESAAAERLEAFMATYLKDHPEFDGVHYSDLFEQYLPLRDKPRRLLADWLPEFFFRTPEGTWRPPTDDEERQQKADLRTNGTLRRARRFANALRNSVPPAERDRPENAATLAAWINECRRAGLYDLGKLLYEQGGHSFEVLSDKEQLEVQENYLICTRRSQANTDDKKNADLQEKLFQGS